jgi:Tol biopolymer transport system component
MAGQQLEGAQYFVESSRWRRIPHIIASSIYERLIGQAGRFDDGDKN